MGFFDRVEQFLSRTTQQFVEKFEDIIQHAGAHPEQRSRGTGSSRQSARSKRRSSPPDVGVAATERIVAAVRSRDRRGSSLRELVKAEILAILRAADVPSGNGHRPHVVIVGVNGTGETTTVGKLARLIKDGGQTPLICAADTFVPPRSNSSRCGRPAPAWISSARGPAPIRRWSSMRSLPARRATATSCSSTRRAGSIARESHDRAGEDSAHRRARGRESTHEVLLVLDATVGQNGLAQAREFMSVAGVNGIVLTKLDGTAKGGSRVAIANDLKLPIRYVGVGEGIDDLIPFAPQEFASTRSSGRSGDRRRRLYGARAAARRASAGTDAESDGRRAGGRRRRRGRQPAGGARARGWSACGSARPRRCRCAGDRATLYCTLGRCAHTGRTGPCAPRVVEAGIRRAVITHEDPNPRVRGRGLQYLRDHGVEVAVGVLADEAARLNRQFFTVIQHGRPSVTLKAALSLDGMVAARRGARTALTGPEANALVHQERAEVDAIAIGSETLLVDDPVLTARGVYRDRPLVRVVSIDACARRRPRGCSRL